MQLTLEDKRKAVYASLLRFSNEAESLRERASDRVVLGALLGSSLSDPFRVGRIQEPLTFGSTECVFRPETIVSCLERLQKVGLVVATSLRTRNAYYITEEGENAASKLIVQTTDLFEPVIERLFKDTKGFIDSDVAGQV